MVKKSNKIQEIYKTLKLYCKLVRLYPCTFTLRGSRRVLHIEVVEYLWRNIEALKTSENTLGSFIRFYTKSVSYKRSFKQFLTTFVPTPKHVVENGIGTYHHIGLASDDRLLHDHIKEFCRNNSIE